MSSRIRHLLAALTLLMLASSALAADIEASDSALTRRDGLLWLGTQPLNGTLVARAASGAIVSRSSYLAGIKHGPVEQFDQAGNRIRLTPYVAGKRDGVQLSWYADGSLQSRTPYVAGLIDGESEQWSPSGQLLQRQHHLRGHEQGLQQSWLEDGELAFAYVYRDGRRYGVVGSKPCYTVNGTATEVFNEGL